MSAPGDKREPITFAEAREILSRFSATIFNSTERERARITIPANPDRDDDIRLGRFIDEREAAAMGIEVEDLRRERASKPPKGTRLW